MQKKQESKALVWFHKNLRTQDNTSLSLATKNNDKVVAVTFVDPRFFEVSELGFKKMEKFRAKFLLETLAELEENLQKLYIPLLVYPHKPEDIFSSLIEELDIDIVYTQKEWTAEETKISKAVKSKLPKTVKWVENYDQFLFHPEDIPLSMEEIPQVFSNFRKRLEKETSVRELQMAVPKKPSNLFKVLTKTPTLEDLGFKSFEQPNKTAFPFKGGENQSLKRLKEYFFKTKKIGVYKKTRNGLIGTDYSSKFSSWLANGSISPREIYRQIKEFEKTHYKNQSTYWLIFELIWRDYFKYISLKHGNKIFKIGGILNRNYSWDTNPEAIRNWINGNTSDDFVNANMIELKETGWMSNRGRQNVASFFSKELKLDWRIGASYFESMLIDYDVHSNYGNWMYVSGVGNDPRDRKFNTQLQAQRYDEKGYYRKRWLQKTLF